MTKQKYTKLNKRKKKKYLRNALKNEQGLIFIDGMGDSKLLNENYGREDAVYVLDFTPKSKSQSLNPMTGEIK